MKVAIVGAGISGLAAAYDLQQAGNFEVTIFEQASTVGGKIQTVQVGDYLIEQGPDSIFSVKPWAVQLMGELGMDAELVEPLGSEFSILTKGKLHTVPRPLASLIPSASGALEKAGFLTAAAKKRALKEAEIGPSGGGGDESVASFFRRRFGRTFSEMVAEPLLAGTHAGDPEKLSMMALYPSYLGMERDHGSVSKAAAARQGATSHRGAFLTLAGGMAEFPRRLLAALTHVSLLTSTAVTALRQSPEGVVLSTSAGDKTFDHVILATPAYVTAKLLADSAPKATEILSRIRFVSTAIATFAFPRSAFPKPLHGNGFLVPTSEPSPITGCTWSSNKWADRAPDDTLLLRAFMGRDGGFDVDPLSDEELIALASDALNKLLKPSQAPVLSRVDRWSKGMAQYEIGHVARIAEVEQGVSHLPVSLVGSSYKGNSIPDCVRQGRDAAKRLIER